MSEDWYEQGVQSLLDGITNIIVDHEDSPSAAEAIYGYLQSIGLIDYDIEKDIFYEWFGGEDDED